MFDHGKLLMKMTIPALTPQGRGFESNRLWVLQKALFLGMSSPIVTIVLADVLPAAIVATIEPIHYQGVRP
jgi:hypothetical protein